MRAALKLNLSIAGLALSLGLIPIMSVTSRVGDEPADSELYWLTWILFPLLVAAVSFTWPRQGLARTLTFALLGPWLVLIPIAGTVWHDPADGANFWPVAEILTLIQVGWTLGLGCLGGVGRRVWDHLTTPRLG